MQRVHPASHRIERHLGRVVCAGALFAELLGAAGCGSNDSGPEGSSGLTFGGSAADTGGTGSSSGGTAGAAASTGGANTTGGANAAGGAAAAAGNQSAGGARAAGGALAAGGATSGGSNSAAGAGSRGTQPLGAICANDGNCSQADGAAVCCVNTCTLATQCPTSSYLPCNSAADCSAYAGGKICCEQTNGNQTMRFCTKQSACSGQILP